MKITLFTANQFRHNYLINLLSGVSKELYVVQENDTLYPGEVQGHPCPAAVFVVQQEAPFSRDRSRDRAPRQTPPEHQAVEQSLLSARQLEKVLSARPG